MVLPAASVRQWHLAAAAPRGAVAPCPHCPQSPGTRGKPQLGAAAGRAADEAFVGKTLILPSFCAAVLKEVAGWWPEPAAASPVSPVGLGTLGTRGGSITAGP